jgi:regulator of sirC expression with transglutaminase-like and TPR domain
MIARGETLMRILGDNDRRALLKLLADNDATVLQLVGEQLTEIGTDGRAFLESVATGMSGDAKRGAQWILRTLQEREAREAFANFCAICDGTASLEAGCWLLARTRYPELDKEAYQTRLDEMARELRERLTGRETPRATIEVCNRHLYQTLGFRGNRADYYDPDNTYLNRVLDRRLGIPISLGTLYLVLARRLRLPLYGVNMPGHFLLTWHSRAAQFFVDPFNEGRLISEADCRDYCEQMGWEFRPQMLAVASVRRILLRMCHNLRTIYAASDEVRAGQLDQFIALLSRE